MKGLAQSDFSKLFESLPGQYLVLAPDMTILAATDTYLKSTMAEREKVIGLKLFDAFPDNQNEAAADAVASFRASFKFVLTHKVPHIQAMQKYDIPLADGTLEERFWSPMNTPVLDEHNEVSYVIHRGEDITEIILSKREEDAQAKINSDLMRTLQEKEKETYNRSQEIAKLNKILESQVDEKSKIISEIFDRISDAFMAFDKNGCFALVNKSARLLTKLGTDELIGRKFIEIFPLHQWSPIFLKAYDEAIAVNKSRHVELFSPAYQKWLEIDIYPSEIGLSLFFRDISERKEISQHLEKSYEDIRELVLHLQSVREDERTSIAREIHDELGQQLTVLKMDVSWLKKKINTEDESLKQKLTDLQEMLDNTVKSVRRISSELRPSLLDDLGLSAAMEWQLKEFDKRSGIQTSFSGPQDEINLSDKIRTNLFRVFQECLTNVARHSEAKNVSVTLEYAHTSVILTIEDDGKGFEESTQKEKKTLGILGMKERTLMMGGDYQIASIPGKGTTVLVIIPKE